MCCRDHVAHPSGVLIGHARSLQGCMSQQPVVTAPCITGGNAIRMRGLLVAIIHTLGLHKQASVLRTVFKQDWCAHCFSLETPQPSTCCKLQLYPECLGVSQGSLPELTVTSARRRLSRNAAGQAEAAKVSALLNAMTCAMVTQMMCSTGTSLVGAWPPMGLAAIGLLSSFDMVQILSS